MTTLDPTAAAELPETPDTQGAFPRLGKAQVAALEARGERRRIQPGEVLFLEGEPVEYFYVILEGKAAAVEGYGTPEERIARVHGRHRFLGELSTLTGGPQPFTAVIIQEGWVLAVPVAKLRELVLQDPLLGDEILRACLIRRSLTLGLGAGFRIIGSRYSQDTRRLRDFAMRNRLPHRFLDLESDPSVETLLHRLGLRPEETPVVVWRNRVLRNPGNAEVAELAGMSPSPGPGATCDLLVIGAGPAGLAAAVYGASEGLTTVALEAVAVGGQASLSSRIENYLGFPAGISGGELADRAAIQAAKFGASTNVPAVAEKLVGDGDHYRVRLGDGSEVSARTLVLATGTRYRRLPVPRVEQFEKTNIFYAATLVEAMECSSDSVIVVGGGNSAGQAAIFLADHVSRLRLVVRERQLDESMSRYLADRIERDERIEVLLHTEVRELLGDAALEAVVVEDNLTGDRLTLEACWLFVFIGADPGTDWVADAVALDSGGYVLTGAAARANSNGGFDALGREPLFLETSAPGVFAVGDVRSGSIKRVASAVGEGAMAVRLVHEHLTSPHR
ncbi:MAG: FAD-dependent oxidoreductase [Sciscionella sp.]